MAVHGFGIDAPRAADATQVGEEPLPARFEFGGVVVGSFEAQAFEGEAGARKLLRNAIFGFVVGEYDDFDARLQQGRDDVALQEVDDGHAVVSGDEDSFGHN